MFTMAGDRAGRKRPIIPGAYSVPPLTSFTWVNQAGSTAVQQVANQAIYMTLANNASVNWRLLEVTQPAPPYKVIAQLQPFFSSGSSQVLGIYFYDGTKLYGIEVLSQSAGAELETRTISNVTTGGTTTGITGQYGTNPFGINNLWLQLRNGGGNLNFDYSIDGQNFVNGATSALGAFITPTAIGWGGLNVVTSGNTPLSQSLLNWTIKPNANLNG